MSKVKMPNLPQGKTSVVICGDCEPVRIALERNGAEVVTIRPSYLLPAPVAHHADMLCCHAAENTMVTADEFIAEQLKPFGVNVIPAAQKPGGKYPKDCSLNCLVVGKYAVGRIDSLDKVLVNVLEQNGVKILSVRQGYARCSVAVVDEHSVITADRGIASVLGNAGLDVLLISPGGIVLEGYDTGFIGGCCGKLSADTMLFCGDPLSHPDGEEMLAFLSERGVSAVSSHAGLLLDFGGFIPLCE